MTPSEHTTTANDLLAATAASGDTASLARNARLAQVHALLGKAAGTGADYTAAETALTTFASSPWSGHLMDQALAHAMLAEVA